MRLVPSRFCSTTYVRQTTHQNCLTLSEVSLSMIVMAPLEIISVLYIWTFVSTTALAEASVPKPAVVYRSQHSALVTWQDTDTNPDEYIVEYGTDWQHAKTLSVSRKKNTAMIHSLAPDTLYSVRVKMAPNSHPGPSIKFRTRPVAVSFTALTVAVQSLEAGKLLVTWRLPQGMRPSDVVHFSLIFCPLYSPYFRKTALVLPGHYRSFTLRYLRPETVYKVKLAALLKRRKGPYSSWAIEQTGGEIGFTSGHGDGKTTQSTALLHSRTQEIVQKISRPTTQHQLTDLPKTSKTTLKQQHSTTQETIPINRNTNEPLPQTTPTPASLLTTQHTFPQTNPSTRQQVADRQASMPTSVKPLTKAQKGLAPTHEVATESREIDGQEVSTSSPITRKITSTRTTLVISGPLPTVSDGSQCEVIEPSMCSENGYHTTKVRHNDQKQMNQHVENMWSRLSSICKSREILKQFLCAVDFPYCSMKHGGPFLPCRSMCTAVKSSCGLDNYADWPTELDCENFPKTSESKLCIGFGHSGPAPTPTNTPLTLVTEKLNPRFTLSTMRTVPGQTTSSPGNVGHESTSRMTTDEAVTEIPTREGTTSRQTSDRTTATEPGQPVTSPGNVESSTDSMTFHTNDVVTQIPSTKVTTSFPIVATTQATTTTTQATTPTTQATTPTTQATTTTTQATTPTTQATTTTTQATTTTTQATTPTTQATTHTTQATTPTTQATTTTTQATTPTTQATTPTTQATTPTTQATTPTTQATTTTTQATTTTTQASTESHGTVQNGGRGASSVGVTSTVAPPPSTPSSPPEGCEPIKLRICNGAGYTMAQFPNYFNQTHQNDVARALFHYWPLVEAECSSKFALFICSLYTPVCTKSLPRGRVTVRGNILPCRSVCEQVSRECDTLMKIYEYTWPDGMQDCQKFPEDGKDSCLYGNTDVTDTRDLVKFAEPPKQLKQQKLPPNEKLGVSGCQEFPVGHVCKNYYMVGALSNTSKSFKTVHTAIRNRIALVKGSASKKCVRNLELFMCSMYAPKCSMEYEPQQPCRSQCRTTLRRCNGALQTLNILIPELNNCRQFPVTRCTGHKRKLGKKRKLEIESL